MRAGTNMTRSMLSFFKVVVVGENQDEKWCLELVASAPVLDGLAFQAIFLSSGELVVSTNDQIVIYSLNETKIGEEARIQTLSGGCTLSMSVFGQKIAVAEVLRAVAIYTWDPKSKTLKMDAHDGGSRVVSTLKLFGPAQLLIAEHQGTLNHFPRDLS